MENMEKKKNYYVVKEKAIPEVLLKVVEAKKLLDTGKADTVQDAAEQVGISRSSFYKYKDDIFPFHEKQKEKLSHLLFRWKMSLEFYQQFYRRLHIFAGIS